MKTSWIKPKTIAVGLALLAVPASAWVSIPSRSFVGPLPPNLHNRESCFTDTIELIDDTVLGLYEVRVNPEGVLNDGDPNTYLKCDDQGNETYSCTAGLPDGRIANCYDILGPFNMPKPGDRVHLYIDPNDDSICDVIISKVYGEDNPHCPGGPGTSGTGGASGTGGSGSTGGSTSTGGTTGTGGSGGGSAACNASNASRVIVTGQETTIASNACVQLKNDAAWGTVNPSIQSKPSAASFPVPYRYTSCQGNGTANFSAAWETDYLGDGGAVSSNFGCDIFVKLGGNGDLVTFQYYL